jgi:hypothetical protein
MRTPGALVALAVALLGCAPAQPAPQEEIDIVNEDLLSSEAPAPFDGTWAVDAASCAIPQEQEGAPHVFTVEGYDQHESHCSFSNVIPYSENEWRIGASCTIDGDDMQTAFDLSLDGDTLIVDRRQRLVRCP